MLSMLLIIASVIISCLETMEYFSESQSTQHQVIHILEIICVIWFTAEILIRFIVCPSKRKFIKQIMNWLDFAAIIPFYLQLFLTNTEMNSIVALRIIRLIRVFRVFKLSRHSYSLQILGHTLRSSLSELFLLGFFLSIGVVVFSTLMFYAEHESGAKKFSSIPAGFWWAVVTMTTLGYGDIVPETLPGKLVGAACAICGVLTIALPIPVIVSNFSLYYSHAKAKQKASQRKRPLVIGAANALKVIDPFVGSRTTNLGLSGMSENASCMSPSSRVRTWPKIALDMAGSSFDSSEPPGSPNRRRLSRLPDKFWQFDQARNFDNNNMKQCISSKYINETSAQISEDYCRGSEDFTIIVPERPHDMSTMSSAMGNRLSITSYTQDEPCQDLAKCFDPSETKKFNGAYENEAIEQNSENENTPRTVPMTFQFEDGELSSDEDSVPQGEQYYRNQSTLPKIEIICNSSASQMSGSNNEDETNDRKSSRKTKKKLKRSHFAVEKAISSPALIGQGFSGKNLPGRMGRRGSVFVVGFLGKRWQAKAAKSRKNRSKSKRTSGELSPNKSHLELLEVSPTISSRGSSPNDESCRTSITSFNTPNSSVSSTSMVFRFPGNQASPEPSSFRRSSCPTLPTLNISEDKMDLKGHNEDENSAKYCDTNDIVLGSGSLDETRSNDTILSEERLDTNQPELDTKDSDVHTKHNRVDTNHCEVNTKHNEFETKGNKFQTKHDVDFKRNRVDTNHHEADAKKLEGEKGSPEMDEEVGNICKEKAKVDINCSELNRELSNEGTRIDSKGNKSDMMLKQEKLVSNQRSFLSNESDSSLKAEFDGTVPRSSSPLMRQKAFMSCKEREDKSLDNNDEMQGPSLQNCFTIDHAGKTFDYHGKSGKPSKSETDGLDSVPKTKRSIITLVIGKNQPSNSQFSSPDSLKTLTIENTKQGGTKNMPSSIIQKTSDDEYNLTKGSSDNNGNLTDTETTFKSKQGVQMKKIISETIQDKPKIKSVADNQAIITNEDRGKDLTGRTIKLVNKTGKPSNPHFTNKEIESTQNFQATEYASENENTGGRNNEVYVKSLMRENGGFKKSNFIPSTANQQKQGLINGHSDGNETKDDTQDRMNGISPRDQGSINDLHFDDKCHIDETNKKIGCINNYAQNDGKNKPTDQPIQNNNRDSTDVRKDETVDTPEHKNPTISPVNVKKNLTNNLYKTNQSTTENENFRENTVASKFQSRNLAYKGGQYHSLTSSMSSQGSADQSKSFEYTINSGTLRKVEAQDSGIYCSDYRSSIDSVSSLTERNSDREMLKTISEVEHDYDYRDGMLYFQPLSGQYYEKSRSYVLEIRDETPV